jgi:hypothetical protein
MHTCASTASSSCSSLRSEWCRAVAVRMPAAGCCCNEAAAGCVRCSPLTGTSISIASTAHVSSTATHRRERRISHVVVCASV